MTMFDALCVGITLLIVFGFGYFIGYMNSNNGGRK